jgi:O-antigen/teichoic acid export membrane protein
LPLVASLVVSLVLAPWFGDRQFGIYFLAMTVATFALIPAKFGIQVATSRLLSENEEEPGPWLRAGLLARTAFTLPTAAALVLLAPFLADRLGSPDQDAAFALAAAVVVSTSVFEFATESLVGLHAFRAQVAARLAALALRLGAVFLVRFGGYSVVVFLAAHALAFLLPGLLALGVLLYRCPGRPTVDRIRRTMSVATPMAFASASFLIYSHTDRLMLGWMHGPELVAQFGVARNVIDAALFPAVALTWSLRPGMVRALREGGVNGLRPGLREGTRLSLGYVFLAVALFAPIGDRLLTGLFGSEYRDAGLYFLALLPALALRGATTVIFPGMVALDRQAAYGRLMGLTAAANFVMNLALIPRFGAWGATASTFVALLALSIGGVRHLRADGCTGFIRNGLVGALPALAAGIACSLVLSVARARGMDWIGLFALAALLGLSSAGFLLRRNPPRLGTTQAERSSDAP